MPKNTWTDYYEFVKTIKCVGGSDSTGYVTVYLTKEVILILILQNANSSIARQIWIVK